MDLFSGCLKNLEDTLRSPCAPLTCSPLHHHLSGGDSSAHCCYDHRVEAAWFEGVEAVSAGFTGDTFIFDDHVFMDQ